MIVWTVILALVILVLALPAAVLLRYEAGVLQVRLRVGPVNVTVYPPRPAKPAKKPAKGAKAPKSPKAAAPKAKSGGKKLTRGQIQDLIKLALDLLGKLRRKLLVKHLTLHVFFGGRDAAQTAIGYGRAWAVIGAMMPVLENTFRIDERDVGAYLDYELEQPRLLLDLDVQMRVGTALVLALGAATRLLGIFTKTSKNKVNQGSAASIGEN